MLFLAFVFIFKIQATKVIVFITLTKLNLHKGL
jgi:hypothetical protein